MARRPHPQRALALAGVLAPILFAAVVAILTVAEYDFARELGWHPVRRTAAGWPSILALGDLGWLLTATLAVCGVLGSGFAVGLYRATAGSLCNALGAATLGMLAVAVGLEAFTTDPPRLAGPPTWHGEIHDAAYPVIVAAALCAPLFFAVGLARDPRWRRYAGVSLAAAAVLVATLVLQVERSYAQALEYPFFATLLLWLELLALRLLRLTGPEERRRRIRSAEPGSRTGLFGATVGSRPSSGYASSTPSARSKATASGSRVARRSQ